MKNFKKSNNKKSTLFRGQRNYKNKNREKSTRMIDHSFRSDEKQKQEHIEKVEISQSTNQTFDFKRERDEKKQLRKIDEKEYRQQMKSENIYFILKQQQNKLMLMEVPQKMKNQNQKMIDMINSKIDKNREKFKNEKVKNEEDRKIVKEKTTRKHKINKMLTKTNIKFDEFLHFTQQGKTVEEILTDEYNEEFNILNERKNTKIRMIERIKEFKNKNSINQKKQDRLIKKMKKVSRSSSKEERMRIMRQLEKEHSKTPSNEKDNERKRKERLEKDLKDKFDESFEDLKNLSDEELEKLLEEKSIEHIKKNIEKLKKQKKDKFIRDRVKHLEKQLEWMNNNQNKRQQSKDKMSNLRFDNKTGMSEMVFKVPVNNENNLDEKDCRKILEIMTKRCRSLGIHIQGRRIHQDESSPHIHLFLHDPKFDLLKKQMDFINQKYKDIIIKKNGHLFDYKRMSKQELKLYGELSQNDKFDVVNQRLKENMKTWRVQKKEVPEEARIRRNKKIEIENQKPVSKRYFNNLNMKIDKLNDIKKEINYTWTDKLIKVLQHKNLERRQDTYEQERNIILKRQKTIDNINNETNSQDNRDNRPKMEFDFNSRIKEDEEN